MYSTVLEQWLDADAGEVLGASSSQLDLVDAGGQGGLCLQHAERRLGAAVAWLAAAGITTGTAPGRPQPDDFVTHHGVRWPRSWVPAEAVPQADRGLPSPTCQPAATTRPIDWLFAEGITTGAGPGRFDPEDIVTHGQMATFSGALEGCPVDPLRPVSAT